MLVIKAVLTFVGLSMAMAFVAVAFDFAQKGAWHSWEEFFQYVDNLFLLQTLRALVWESRWARLYWLMVIISVFLNSRRILFRLWDKEIRRDNTSGLN
jgi:hypothetical protein